MPIKSKSFLGVIGANSADLKSELNSGKSNQISNKSNRKILENEIAKMHNKIMETRKMISERQCVLDQEKRKVQNLTRGRTCTAGSDVVCSSPQKSSESNANMSQERKSKLSCSKSIPHIPQQGASGDPTRQTEHCGKYATSGLQKSQSSSSSLHSLNSLRSNLSENSINNSNNANLQGDLVSVSKYKLTRVGSSPTKLSARATDTLGSKTLSQSVSRNSGNSSPNVDLFNLSNKKPSIVSDSFLETASNTRTPAKFIKKSKYSLITAKNSGKKGLSRNKPTRHHTNTPAKFVSYSKYAIKRVRRSLSDETKQVSNGNTGSLRGTTCRMYKNTFPVTGSGQSSVTVLKSKFKLEKRAAPKFMVKTRYKLSQSSPYYRVDRKRLYKQRKFHMYKQRYDERQHLNDRFGFHGYTKRGRHKSQYGRQGRHYGSYIGRHQKTYQYPSNSRQLSVSQRYIQRRIQLLKEKIPFNPKHRLDRRKIVPDKRRPLNFVMINGMLYRSNSNTLEKAVMTKPSSVASKLPHTKIKKSATSNMKTVTVRGVKFQVDSQGRSLMRVQQLGTRGGSTTDVPSPKVGQVSRIDIGGVTYMQTKPGMLERVGSVKSRMAAARVVNKTVQRAAAKYKKDNTKVIKKKYCMFYNRFGKCNKKGNCPYIHDPEKVAVCTRFLRGTCKVKDCPFSHKVSKDKMPTCSYFLKGVCNRDDCPYPHVNVNKDAEICEDFLKGYCPLAEKCTKKHILRCPEFSKTGVCSKGDKCKLQHRKARKRTIQMSGDINTENSKKSNQSNDNTTMITANTWPAKTATDSCNKVESSTDVDDKQGKVDAENDASLPFREKKLPAYISLKTSNNARQQDVIVIQEEDRNPVKPTMRIRPQF